MSKKKPYTGLINQSIGIYKAKNVDNNNGGVEPRQEIYWQTSAEVKTAKCARIDQAGQTQFVDGFKIMVRDRIDKMVTPTMRIKWREGWLTITKAEPDYIYNEFLAIEAIWSRPGRRTGEDLDNG